MPYQASHRFARIAPRKARLVMDLIRGREIWLAGSDSQQVSYQLAAGGVSSRCGCKNVGSPMHISAPPPNSPVRPSPPADEHAGPSRTTAQPVPLIAQRGSSRSGTSDTYHRAGAAAL